MQLDLFSASTMDQFKLSDKHLRVIELFAGIGAQARSIERLAEWGYLPKGYELYRVVEFDKAAINSYNAVHGTNFPTIDVTKIHAKDLGIVERERENYLMTYSYPCTDVSLAGKRGGMAKGSGTRSSLLWEVERLLKECGKELPQVLVMENVPAVQNDTNKAVLNDWLDFLESIGYKNFYKILNAKEVGFPEPIPQNRERFFMISLLDGSYIFPNKSKLRLRLKDMLEEEVDEKYYLSEKMMNYIVSKDDSYKVNEGNLVINRDIACAKTTREGTTRADCSDYVVQGLKEENVNITKSSFQEVYDKIKNSSFTQASKRLQEKDICDTLLARDYKDPKCIVDLKRGYSCEVAEEKTDTENVDIIGNYSKSEFGQTSIVGKNGIASTVTENHGQVTAIAIKNATKQGYLLAEDGDDIDISSRMETHRGTVQKQTSQTITTSGGNNVGVVVKNEPLVSKLCNDLIKNNKVKENDVIKTNYTKLRVDGKKEIICGNNISPTLTTRVDSEDAVVVKTQYRQVEEITTLRIRKLTPKECWRLMGFDDEAFDKAQKVNSNAQLYKQAGNSIVVNCLTAIFKEMC